ncbi:hypothetical protein F5Y15DRAFT_391263 [Xylariaceae sp. FL0016]|nr:hypothetical protein F5Y15DRAFT_391263 [Xylariaceae sp. FL0016]
MTTTGLFFRIVYNSIYVLLCLILAVLLLIVPADFVEQALRSTHQLINLIVIAIVYVLTVLIVAFVYVLRLYVTRTVLASIPKTRIPIEKGDVGKEVRNMILASISRSAAVAWEARPKVLAPDVPRRTSRNLDDGEKSIGRRSREGRKSLQMFRSRPPLTAEDEMGIALPSLAPVWGDIQHLGWGSPASADLPNLQYSTVLSELPNLIEARAVSQAPTDPTSTLSTPALDADAVALLQRNPSMTMRDYIAHLTHLRVLPTSQVAAEFTDLYEQARFSDRPLSDTTFRRLMHLFAEILRGMQILDGSVLHVARGLLDASYSESDGHIDDDAPLDTTPTTPARSIGSFGGISRTSSHEAEPGVTIAPRQSSANTWHQYRTAPTTPRSKTDRRLRAVSRSPSIHSANSFAQTRQPYAISQASSSSQRSTSQGSVIRLASEQDIGDLPYVLRLTDTL